VHGTRQWLLSKTRPRGDLQNLADFWLLSCASAERTSAAVTRGCPASTGSKRQAASG